LGRSTSSGYTAKFQEISLLPITFVHTDRIARDFFAVGLCSPPYSGEPDWDLLTVLSDDLNMLRNLEQRYIGPIVFSEFREGNWYKNKFLVETLVFYFLGAARSAALTGEYFRTIAPNFAQMQGTARLGSLKAGLHFVRSNRGRAASVREIALLDHAITLAFDIQTPDGMNYVRRTNLSAHARSVRDGVVNAGRVDVIRRMERSIQGEEAGQPLSDADVPYELIHLLSLDRHATRLLEDPSALATLR
jgi:hypothetical protein